MDTYNVDLRSTLSQSQTDGAWVGHAGLLWQHSNVMHMRLYLLLTIYLFQSWTYGNEDQYATATWVSLLAGNPIHRQPIAEGWSLLASQLATWTVNYCHSKAGGKAGDEICLLLSEWQPVILPQHFTENCKNVRATCTDKHVAVGGALRCPECCRVTVVYNI